MSVDGLKIAVGLSAVSPLNGLKETSEGLEQLSQSPDLNSFEMRFAGPETQSVSSVCHSNPPQ